MQSQQPKQKQPTEAAGKSQSPECPDPIEMGNGQPDCPLPDGRTTAIFPPLRTDDGRKIQPPHDSLDESLMESFPCSDPPCYSGSHA